jgi:hypothetical protein
MPWRKSVIIFVATFALYFLSRSPGLDEIDSVNFATSAPGPALNRPLRETGDFFFIRLSGSLWRLRRVQSKFRILWSAAEAKRHAAFAPLLLSKWTQKRCRRFALPPHTRPNSCEPSFERVS